jgi:hypothetical protein
MFCIKSGLLAFVVLPALWGVAQAQSLEKALAGGKPLIDLRARYETVTDASKPVDASAQTLRARIGYETAPWNGLRLTVEFDQLWAIGGTAYNSTRNGKTLYPLIADPGMTALNRLQLSFTSDFATKFVFGRQRLLIGNQRFVGNSGWRQHEQTFDALAVTNTSFDGLILNYAYLYRVNRIGGPATPAPANTAAAATSHANYFKSNSHVMDAVYAGISGLRLESYAFLLDLSAPGFATGPAQQAATARLSTATYGVRADYSRGLAPGISAKLTGEYAHQTSYAGNPLAFGLDYERGEASASDGPVTALAGYELLGGNGTIGFSTPLATLHAFNGWADLFLATPANGLRDMYANGTYALPVPPDLFNSATLTAAYHSYSSDVLDRGLGSEWDAQIELVMDPHSSLLAKFADYQGSGVAASGFADKRIGWVQTAYKF